MTRILKMLLLYDVIEPEAGDPFCYDAQTHPDKAARELAAAVRTFGLLPDNLHLEPQRRFSQTCIGAASRFAHIK